MVALRAIAARTSRVNLSLLVGAMGLTDYGLEEPSIALMWSLLLGVGAGLGRG